MHRVLAWVAQAVLRCAVIELVAGEDKMASSVVEVEVVPGEPPVLVEVATAGGGDVGLRERLHLDEVGDMVRTLGEWTAGQARTALPEVPEEFEVSFGVKIGVKSGKLVGILAEASGEASLTVRMLWRKPDESQPADA